MADALIGYTGYVGGSILRARAFDALYRSTNIESIRGQQFDTVVCCGAPAEKWRANLEPDEDQRKLAVLTDALSEVEARRVILISTVDVYPVPHGVDEHTPIDPAAGQPYGRHRLAVEAFCRARFDTTIIRLPGLFGRGLKKNAIYDLLHDRPVDTVAGNARFQFYDTERVWQDVERVLAMGITLANVTSEPTDMASIARFAFGRELPLAFSPTAPSYDVQSVHAAAVGGRDGYWFAADQVLAGIRAFVERERAA